MQENNFEKENPWIHEITTEDLPNEDLKIVAGLLGIDVALKLMYLLPGFTVIIPAKSVINAKNRYILKHYDGTKAMRYRLMVECRVSEKYIFNVVKKRNSKTN